MPINASAMTEQQQITAIYVAYYDRAPDPAGLQFWVDQLQGGRSLAQIASDFSGAAETKAKYPYFDAPDVASADTFITGIYTNLFGRTPDSAGLDFWSDQLESGSTPVGEIILAILEGAQSEADGGFPDEATVNNKIEAGLDWAESAIEAGIGLSSDPIAEEIDGKVVVNNEAAFDSATNLLDGVDGTAASLADAKAETDAFIATGGGLGETFTLTTGTDNLIGTSGNDTFIGSVADNPTDDGGITSINASDVIDGGEGFDTFVFNIENSDHYETAAVPEITNIEQIVFRNFADTDYDFGGTGPDGRAAGAQFFDGVEEVVFRGGNDNVDISGVPQLLDVALENTSADDFEVEYQEGVLAGASDTQVVRLDNAGVGESDMTELDVDGYGSNDLIEEFDIRSNGSENFLDLYETSAMESLLISGEGDLYLNLTNESALTSVDASAHTGDLEFANRIDVENDFTYTGSQGADTFHLEDNDAGGHTFTVNTGTGDDDVTLYEQDDNIVNVDLGEDDDRLELEDAGTVADTFQADDSYNGGAGMDRLVATSAALGAATAASAANVSNFEVLGVSDGFDTDLDIDVAFSSINEVVLEGGLDGSNTLAGLDTGAILTSEDSGSGLTLTVDMEDASSNTDDVLNLVLTNESNTNFGAFDTTDIETVNIEADDADDDADADHTTIIDGSGTETLVITGDAASLDLGGAAAGDTVTMVDSTGFEGDLTIDLSGNTNDVTVNLGAGDDTVTSGDGADELSGGGGENTFVYDAASQSSGSNIDTIADFLSGSDQIDLSNFEGGGGQYLGEVNGTNAANSAFTTSAGDAVFDTSTNQLIVDEGDGTVGSGDLVIELTGVTELDGTTDFIF